VRRWKLSIGLTFALAMFAATTSMTAPHAAAQTETILHSFGSPRLDGQRPTPGLAVDASGNVYGTTFFGGAYGYGMLFELTPAVGGGYAEKVIHSFNFNHTDGIYPAAGVILDAAGNLYGTASQGGANGYGAVFEFSPHAGGSWAGKSLYSFRALPDGENPYCGLTFDAAGNLYGTTAYGGIHGANGGTVFKLTPSAGGPWTKKTLYSFTYGGTDGYYSLAGVIFDASGNIYGTTTNGGLYRDGIAFELTPASTGEWPETILHNFGNGTDGQNPAGPLIFDGSGNLYGGALNGGANTLGMVFELSPVAGGGWNENVVYTFSGATDGNDPGTGGLIFDGAGNLYGTTGGGGPSTGGTLFKLTPAGGGTWTLSNLWGFGASGDGNGAQGVTVDASGNFYGTTVVGGAHNLGTVFEVTP
jgi:uncharacterized repeat protein (TIGR03803 family)